MNANTSCIKVRLKDLDGVASEASGVKDQRFPTNFKVVVNFRPEKEIKKFEIAKSPARNLGLIFTSQAEHESNHSMMELSGNGTSNGRTDNAVGEEIFVPPKAPPRLKNNTSLEKSSRSPTPTSMKSNSQESGLRIADLISPVVDLPPEVSSGQTKVKHSDESFPVLIDTDVMSPIQQPNSISEDTSSSTMNVQNNIASPTSNAFLLDLGFGSSPVKSQIDLTSRNQSQISKEEIPSTNAVVDNLLDISGAPSSTAQLSQSVGRKVAPDVDLFGSQPTDNYNSLISNAGSKIHPSNSGSSLFTLADDSSAKQNADTNLLGDFGDFAGPSLANANMRQPQIQTPLIIPTTKHTSTADEILDNLLSGLDVNKSDKAKPSTQNIGANYNSSFFAEPPKKQTFMPQMSSKKVAPDTFNDLLGGFTSSQSTPETRTIGEMRKKEEMKQMTPLEAKVFAWKDGKSRNLRALLCSLHNIMWEGSRWQQCGMHQLVTEKDVNKMYKKALLAVHPDRQQGTENEEISTLLQKELNDAWTEYKKDSS